LGHSTGDIKCKLQKLRPTKGRNLKVLLDEAWRVFSNREEGTTRGRIFLVDAGATYLVLNQALMPLGIDYIMVKGATGQSEKA